jgi:hypothetical protein
MSMPKRNKNCLTLLSSIPMSMPKQNKYSTTLLKVTASECQVGSKHDKWNRNKKSVGIGSKEGKVPARQLRNYEKA